MSKIIFIPIKDYLLSRKRLVSKFLIPLVIAAMVVGVLFGFNECLKIETVFSEFIGVQINIVAILISFSVAIITILVSSDNANLHGLKNTLSSKETFKPIAGKQLSLFQVMLSNIAYNAEIEILYLLLLIAFSLIKNVLSNIAMNIIVGVCVLFITHILLILLESISQMYLTFWKREQQS